MNLLNMTNDLLTIMQENLYLKQRQELLGRIEGEFSKRFSKKVSVVSYIFNTSNPTVSMPMNISHLSHIEDLVRVTKENKGEVLAIIIESLGGDANFPPELDDRIRKYYDEYYTIAINIVKSAATLCCLISDKVIALETASFGPIDPQLIISKDGLQSMVSARGIVDLFEKTLPEYTKTLSSQEKVIILSSQNYLLYQQAKDAIKNMGELVDRIKVKKGITDKQLEIIKRKLINEPLSHGTKIGIDDLKRMGVETLKLDVSDNLSELLIEYHRRAIRNLMMESPPGQIGVILFESPHRSLQMGAVLSSTSFPNSGIASPIQRAPIIPPNKISRPDDKAPKESNTLPIKEQLGKEI